ncbi:MAG: ParB/RepB/Spo0J family partition protein [Clostridia bacterium]|jgi:ParB family chromosome partitioning protein|nr:ParB/RepB/Spo0J family partition protein [Clostridia bacterium]MDD3232455.1 ParB/RepB/Spo0J family partition protein [Clostridia bacterium]MDD3862642.1 ParB/RepB/Spo0J family partition protein [Clostridia bacterium]
MALMKKGLGKGLEALFSTYKEDKVENHGQGGNVVDIEITKIEANPNQPRKKFDDIALQELSRSIKQHGVIQPLVVVKTNNEKFMVVAGERRLRASKMAGLESVPCIIKDYSARQIKEIALIENLQREDLNPIESSRAIKQLMEEYNLTQEIVAEKIGKSRSNVANLIRLLNLHPDVIRLIEENKLSAGHARALVVLDDKKAQISIALRVIDKKLSVRELENLIKNYIRPKETKSQKETSIELNNFVDEMQKIFATKISIVGDDNKGKILIEYFSKDDLDRIYELVQLVNNKQLTLQNLSQYNRKPTIKV